MKIGSRAAILLAFCAVWLATVADSSADAVMFRKPKLAPEPTHSFLLDVAPVKVVKEEPKREVAKPAAENPASKVEAAKVENPTPKVEEVTTAPKVEAPKVEEMNPAPKVEEVKVEKAPPAQKVEEPKAEETRKKDDKPVVTVEKRAVKEGGKDAKEKDAKGEKKDAKEKKAPARDAIITADRTDYDRKEGVVLFDRNVHVDDTQYQMHADRLFLFLEGTNELKRLVAIGHVAITNEDKRAYCHRATFNKKLGRVVMYTGDGITAELREEGKKGSDVRGERITFWLDSEQVEVDNPVITMPGGIGGQGSVKKLIGK